MKEYEIKSREVCFSTPWFDLLKKAVVVSGENEPRIFYSMKPGDYVTILARTKDDKIMIVKQFRPAVEEYTYELPSGHIEKNEEPEQAGIRELKEETGCLVEKIDFLGKIVPDTGRYENRLWAFYANVSGVGTKDDRTDERVETEELSLAEVCELVKDGRFKHALDISVIFLAMIKGYISIK